MEHLEHPTYELWESRRLWFEERNNELSEQGSFLVSEQACALIAEVQSVFCAGAWLGVIILAMAVVDAQLRECEIPDFKGNTKKLFKNSHANPELQKLRKRRNELIHLNPNFPAIDVDTQWAGRKEFEKDARKAVKLMFEAFYMSPGT